MTNQQHQENQKKLLREIKDYLLEPNNYNSFHSVNLISKITQALKDGKKYEAQTIQELINKGLLPD